MSIPFGMNVDLERNVSTLTQTFRRQLELEISATVFRPSPESYTERMLNATIKQPFVTFGSFSPICFNFKIFQTKSSPLSVQCHVVVAGTKSDGVIRLSRRSRPQKGKGSINENLISRQIQEPSLIRCSGLPEILTPQDVYLTTV